MKIYICDKCHKEIVCPEMIWKLDGTGNYGSVFDGDHIHKHFCDECLKKFLSI